MVKDNKMKYDVHLNSTHYYLGRHRIMISIASMSRKVHTDTEYNLNHDLLTVNVQTHHSVMHHLLRASSEMLRLYPILISSEGR